LRKPLLAAGAALLLAAAGAARAGEGWWNRNWKARRVFQVTGTRSDLPGDEVGVVEFRTAGLAAADGRDVRVLARGRKILPVRVLASGPDDFLRVCFPLVKEVTGYHVYYGNPQAKAGETFTPRRGVLLASRGYRGGDVGSWKGMLGVIKRAGPSYGRKFVDRIYLGYNPVGPQTNYVNKYTAWLVVPADGEYVFATSSDDASFVFVDGKMVCQWPGWHGAIPQVRPQFSGKATLKKGLVKLDYWHVNGALTGVAVAAWQPPGAKKAVTIPASAFAPVRRGRQQSYELADGRPAADVSYRSAGEAYLDEKTWLVRAAFSVRTGAGGGKPRGKVSWDFGDGQGGSGADVEHVYLKPGTYAVKVTAEGAGQRMECVNRIAVDRDLRRATAGRAEKPEAYSAALAGADLARLSPGDLATLARFYETLGATADRLRVARTLLTRGKDFSDRDYFDQLILAVHELREEKHGEDGRAEALAMLAAAEERFRGEGRRQSYRARVIRERGDLYYFYAGDLDRAYNEYDKVVTRFRGLEDNIVRITKIRLGDIHRERGAYDEAARRYREAEKLKLTAQSGARDDARKGALPQIAENYLRRGKLDQCEEALNVWEWEYPMEKLRGYSTLVRSQLELRRRRFDEAVKQIDVTLKVNPRTNFAGELLMVQAMAHRALRRPDLALACYRRIIKEYPESEQVAKAREKLEAAGKKK
jgi:tetratricopeptide (TPR) repeat protein